MMKVYTILYMFAHNCLNYQFLSDTIVSDKDL